MFYTCYYYYFVISSFEIAGPALYLDCSKNKHVIVFVINFRKIKKEELRKVENLNSIKLYAFYVLLIRDAIRSMDLLKSIALGAANIAFLVTQREKKVQELCQFFISRLN